MQHKEFSVSICVYHGDHPEWFQQAAESILNQTCKPSEVVLVVDGPVPRPLDDVIARYETMDIFKVVRLARNQGHGNARRTGVEHCTKELVALMDADDISLPDRFEKQLAAFESDPQLSVVGGNIAEFMDSEKGTVGYRIVACDDAQIKADLRKRCPFNQMTVMFRKADVMKAGGYLDWFCNEDYYLWIRMYLAGMKFANTPDVLVNVRMGADAYKRRGGWKYFSSEAKLQTYMLEKNIIGLPTYLVNCAKRLAVQVLLPNQLRRWVFQKFARESNVGNKTV